MTADAGSEDDEHTELVRLRAEVRELRERERRRAAPRRRQRWRAPVAALLIAVGCILAPAAVVGIWAANQVSNTDRYVANIAPLISRPPIQRALSARITSEITSRLDITALTKQIAAEFVHDHMPRLAALLNNFAGPIANGVNGFVGAAVSRAVASPAMATLWTQANRRAHAGLVRVLSGQGSGAIDVVNGQVVLFLGPLITAVKDQLSARGLTFVNNVPPVNATFPLFAAPNLAKAQQGYRLVKTLEWVLPLLSLLLMAAGIWIARGHRQALLGAGLGLSASMLVLGAALAIARTIYLNGVSQSVLPSDAAAELYDTLVRFIREALRALLVIGLVVACGAFLTGPSVTAVRTRNGLKSGIGWLRARTERAGLRTGPAGKWTSAHKPLLRVVIVAVAALIFVFWGQPSLALVIWLVVLLLIMLGLIELIGGGQTA